MRILIGVWLLQIMTVGPLWLVLTGQDPALVGLGVAMVLGAGLLAALWFSTLLRDQKRLSEARHSERLANAKARFQATLAKHKSDDAAKLSDLTKKMGRTRTRLLKLGLVTGGALGLGAALFFAQVFTAGLLVAAFAGGSAAGYGVRSYLSRDRDGYTGPEVITMESDNGPARRIGGRRQKFLKRPGT
ncbi:hypothetical protein RGUI_3747 [Rhodovulum sp. P5]|uniref:hypothetical protein n=1 Tax=Rhodovulum sp. P5 TaxID=1564506 RepID=UPI0009C3D742|nr:hypothetical protein [Rhodovulum sp. P5]ARE41888.1 hypothetical protein RGUI_3747 [Rhodovulum sp. P5]